MLSLKKGAVKMILDIIDERYIVRVCDLMPVLPRPKKKVNFIINYGEILPIVSVQVDLFDDLNSKVTTW